MSLSDDYVPDYARCPNPACGLEWCPEADNAPLCPSCHPACSNCAGQVARLGDVLCAQCDPPFRAGLVEFELQRLMYEALSKTKGL